jgi:addiction module RelE/StbE family toxin
VAQVIWSPRALERLDEISDYIALDAPNRAIDFVLSLLESTERLKDHPESGAVIRENEAFRHIVHEGYRIIYRVRAGLVEVVTVIAPGQNAADVLDTES